MALYCFGDSYTEGYKNDMGFPPYNQYLKWLNVKDPKKMPPLWSELLGEKLGVESFNLGKGGASNHEIFLKICEYSSRFKKNDIVIINWTYVLRILWDVHNYNESPETAYTGYNLYSISPHQAEHYDDLGIFTECWEVIAQNRNSFQWTWEVVRYQEIIDSLSRSIGFDVYYWFTDDYLYKNFKRLKSTSEKKYILNNLVDDYNENTKIPQYCCRIFNVIRQYGGLSLDGETNGASEDSYHLGGVGHAVQAEMFYCYIKELPYPEKKLQE